MGVSAYQIHNVLRTYNEILKFHKLSLKREKEDTQVPKDKVTISEEGKNRQIGEKKEIKRDATHVSKK